MEILKLAFYKSPPCHPSRTGRTSKQVSQLYLPPSSVLTSTKCVLQLLAAPRQLWEEYKAPLKSCAGLHISPVLAGLFDSFWVIIRSYRIVEADYKRNNMICAWF